MNELHPTQKLKIRSKQLKENFRKINIITKKWDYIIKESMNPNFKSAIKEAFCEMKEREPGHREKKERQRQRWSQRHRGRKQMNIQFSRSVVSDSLQPHESQHARPPCPSPTPGVHSDSHPLSRWCHPAISFSVVPFSTCPQSLPASESFPMSQLFAWDGQSIGVSASASVLPMNTQGWSPLEWTGWISLPSKGLSRVFSNTTVQKHKFSGAQPSSQSNSDIHTWLLEKP